MGLASVDADRLALAVTAAGIVLSVGQGPPYDRAKLDAARPTPCIACARLQAQGQVLGFDPIDADAVGEQRERQHAGEAVCALRPGR